MVALPVRLLPIVVLLAAANLSYSYVVANHNNPTSDEDQYEISGPYTLRCRNCVCCGFVMKANGSQIVKVTSDDKKRCCDVSCVPCVTGEATSSLPPTTSVTSEPTTPGGSGTSGSQGSSGFPGPTESTLPTLPPVTGPTKGPDPTSSPCSGPTAGYTSTSSPCPGPTWVPNPSPQPGPGPTWVPNPSPQPGPGPTWGPHPTPRPGPGPTWGPHPTPQPGPGPTWGPNPTGQTSPSTVPSLVVTDSYPPSPPQQTTGQSYTGTVPVFPPGPSPSTWYPSIVPSTNYPETPAGGCTAATCAPPSYPAPSPCPRCPQLPSPCQGCPTPVYQTPGCITYECPTVPPTTTSTTTTTTTTTTTPAPTTTTTLPTTTQPPCPRTFCPQPVRCPQYCPPRSPCSRLPCYQNGCCNGYPQYPEPTVYPTSNVPASTTTPAPTSAPTTTPKTTETTPAPTTTPETTETTPAPTTTPETTPAPSTTTPRVETTARPVETTTPRWSTETVPGPSTGRPWSTEGPVTYFPNIPPGECCIVTVTSPKVVISCGCELQQANGQRCPCKQALSMGKCNTNQEVTSERLNAGYPFSNTYTCVEAVVKQIIRPDQIPQQCVVPGVTDSPVPPPVDPVTGEGSNEDTYNVASETEPSSGVIALSTVTVIFVLGTTLFVLV